MNLNELKFTVVECNKTVNGDFHTKLQYKGDFTVEDDFGSSTQESQLTFYRFINKEAKVGKTGRINFALFDIEERPFDTGNDIVMLKYLKPKKG